MEAATIETQIAVCEVPAPPFGEAARARMMKGLFERAGLTAVRIDQEGNVLGERPGRESGPRVVVSAHLDTVFPKGTDVRVTRKGNVLAGPGIGDDCRGLAVLLAVARTLQAHPIPTDRPVLFVATVGEEGLGDLRGVRHLFEGPLKGQIGQFMSFDGDGLGIVSKGVGSRRYRVTFSGPGGHSWGSFGMANPIHALGRAVSGIAALQVPATSENHVQCRPHRWRDIGELHRLVGLDGSGPPVHQPGRARGARSPLPRGGGFSGE